MTLGHRLRVPSRHDARAESVAYAFVNSAPNKRIIDE
jgi:hypothetical protein